MEEKFKKSLIEIGDTKLGNGKGEMVESGKWDCERWKRKGFV
jgi:hypothetical protein